MTTLYAHEKISMANKICSLFAIMRLEHPCPVSLADIYQMAVPPAGKHVLELINAYDSDAISKKLTHKYENKEVLLDGGTFHVHLYLRRLSLYHYTDKPHERLLRDYCELFWNKPLIMGEGFGYTQEVKNSLLSWVDWSNQVDDIICTAPPLIIRTMYRCKTKEQLNAIFPELQFYLNTSARVEKKSRRKRNVFTFGDGEEEMRQALAYSNLLVTMTMKYKNNSRLIDLEPRVWSKPNMPGNCPIYSANQYS